MVELCEICGRRKALEQVTDSDGESHEICRWCEWIFDYKLEDPELYRRRCYSCSTIERRY